MARQKKAPRATTPLERVPVTVEKSVIVEFGSKQISAKQVLEQAETNYINTHPDTEIQSIKLYIAPEKNAAYYVVNGEGSPDFKINL